MDTLPVNRFSSSARRIVCHGLLLLTVGGLASCTSEAPYTEISKWPQAKRGAVSITYDGGTINQFEVALPIMNRLELPATFFIVTGDVTGSSYQRTFVGRPVNEIADEVALNPTDSSSLFERAAAMRAVGFQEMIEAHTRAGDLFELGRFDEAYAEIDAAYAAARRGELTPMPADQGSQPGAVDVDWDALREFARQGHEFASHSVSHAQLAILDDANLRYELEQSRDEIVAQLGLRHGFSVECPYGTENERVMDVALSLYPASRNRMPEPYLSEINRWNDDAPGIADREYVQWQRGPKSSTPLCEMRSWADTVAVHDDIWLVLVYHGVEGIGWEPIPGGVMEAYFDAIEARKDRLWIATFQDVAKYIRQRMAATVQTSRQGDRIRVEVTHSLDRRIYDAPLWLKTYLGAEADSVTVRGGGFPERTRVIETDGQGRYALYAAIPNGEAVELEVN